MAMAPVGLRPSVTFPPGLHLPASCLTHCARTPALVLPLNKPALYTCRQFDQHLKKLAQSCQSRNSHVDLGCLSSSFPSTDDFNSWIPLTSFPGDCFSTMCFAMTAEQTWGWSAASGRSGQTGRSVPTDLKGQMSCHQCTGHLPCLTAAR